MEIDHRLSELETEARAKGSASGSGFLYPVTIERVTQLGQGTCRPGLCSGAGIGHSVACRNNKPLSMPRPGTSSITDDLPYRPCVGIMLINRDGLVFVGRRIDQTVEGWQMPQGGIDDGETPARGARCAN